MKKTLLVFQIILVSSCSLIPSMPEIPDVSKSLSDFSNYIAPSTHKNEINQGSIIRKEKFDLIKNGMTKNEVKSIIGSPSIIDIFHSNQWEYVHHSFLNNDQILSFRVTLFFTGEVLEKIEATKIENISKVEEYNFSKIDYKKVNKDSDLKEDEDAWYKFW